MGPSIFYREADLGHLRIRVRACGVCHDVVVTNFARGCCLDNLPLRGGSSRRAQQDLDLMHFAIVSQWNVRAINKHPPV